MTAACETQGRSTGPTPLLFPRPPCGHDGTACKPKSVLSPQLQPIIDGENCVGVHGLRASTTLEPKALSRAHATPEPDMANNSEPSPLAGMHGSPENVLARFSRAWDAARGHARAAARGWGPNFLHIGLNPEELLPREPVGNTGVHAARGTSLNACLRRSLA